MMKILFVCTGNICRSPTAEAIAQSIVKERDLTTQVLVSSVGLQGHHVGESPDKRTTEAGQKRGLTFDSRAQLFQLGMFFDYDWIVAMDKSHFERLQKIRPKQKVKARVVEMISYCQISDKNVLDGIPDPYYGADKDFELVLDLLEIGVKSFLDREIMPYIINKQQG